MSPIKNNDMGKGYSVNPPANKNPQKPPENKKNPVSEQMKGISHSEKPPPPAAKKTTSKRPLSDQNAKLSYNGNTK
ncbi:hypothetical protein MtrunA17_Chr2g0297601 [Medicago truncatula]|uniref:Uncharacterized protein n=1 Tax=Medicago truncatula TaxID=3880 RepID=A0A072V6H1_MEDTR|nr:hypothetical protein MTR_2g438560 [Medicago truncatula]RHN73360.1 hypothetical protein MtrunA17_Chr2g0297601 [Medicago truncatula]